jgi:biotin carboxylase
LQRLLVLGAGRHQTPLIRRAEARGIEVVVADYLPDSPGKALASHPTMVDALDVEAVCALAKRFAIDGVITTGTDQPVVTMAEVARRFDLPVIVTPQTAEIATNKRSMKDVLERAGVTMPNYVVIRDLDAGLRALEHLRLPVVVKPTDAQGQRGTRRVDDAGHFPDAVAAALDASRSGEALIEEFVDGREVTASAWVTDGAVQILIVTDRVTYNPPPAIGIAVQHVHPSRHALDVAAVRSMLERIRAAYGVERGPMYVQMIVTPSGDLSLVEAACRVGGGHEISLIPIVTGVDLIDRLIDLALTGSCEPFSYEYTGAPPHALVNFLVARPGIIASQSGMTELVQNGTIEEGDFYHPTGYEQAPFENGQSRVGYFIARAESYEALVARTHAAFEQLSIRSTQGEEMLFWPEEQWLLS